MHYNHLRGTLLLFLIALLTLCVPLMVTGQSDSHIYLPAVLNRYQPNKWRWSEPESIEVTGTIRATASNIDNQGNLLLLWETYSTPYFIYYATLTESGWSEARPVAEPFGHNSLIAPMYADDQGNLHLAWKSDLGHGSVGRYRLHYAIWDGTEWEYEQDIYQSDKSPRHAAIRFGGGTQANIALTVDGSHGRIERLEQNKDGWHMLSPLELNIPIISGLWSDQDNRLHILGTRGLWPAELVYSRWEEQRFTVLNEPIGEDVVIGPNDVFDGQGNFHRVWRGSVPVPGGTVMGAYHRCMDTGRVWHEQSVLTGDRSVSDLVTVQPTGDSPFAVVWTEAGVFHPQLGVWDGCQLQEQQSVTTITDGDLVSLTYQGNRLCVLARLDYQSAYSATCATIRAPGASE